MRFRKGEKNDKDLFIEVWSETGGFISSRKVTDRLSKIYNDAVFGGASWSKDDSKIIFIGERAEPAAYKNYWEDEPPKKVEEAKVEQENKGEEEKKKEEAKKQHDLDEKYLY